MPVGEDCSPELVPDRCGYLHTSGWSVLVEPGHWVVLAEEFVTAKGQVIPEVKEWVPDRWGSVPPRARIMRDDLTEADVTPEGSAALVDWLGQQAEAVRAAWGAPPDAVIMPAYTFSG